jgi:pimeloyl-ACP methyl ester carboxylesterase
MSELTIVFVHGAFAESSSWGGVISGLRRAGHDTIAAANPLRSLSGDAASVSSLLGSIPGPIVLVGHSYGGAVTSNAAAGHDNVRALVFVAAFAPLEGESILELSGRLPGSTLGDTLDAVPLSDGSADLYIRQDRFHEQFAADVPAAAAAVLAATQRPLRDVALHDASGPPAWLSLPSWFVFGDADRNIPVAAHRLMADRAGAKAVVELAGTSHALTISRAGDVTEVIMSAIAALS